MTGEEQIISMIREQLELSFGSIYRGLRGDIYSLKKEIAVLKEEIAVLKANLQTSPLPVKNAEKKPEDDYFPDSDRIISEFNLWAGSPSFSLPSQFYYISGDLRIRNSQSITPSTKPTKWISNREGTQTYLFPNPNSFEQIQMTDIIELYTMDTAMLKPKGKNRIRIIEPCEMSETGYINYPGKLELLN